MGKPRGNRGELVAWSLSDLPGRFERLNTVYLSTERASYEPLQVESVWQHGEQLVFKFQGVDSISSAERLKFAEVSIPATERAELPEGEYYQSDLVGFEVVDQSAGLLGVVTGWQECGAPPLLVVQKRVEGNALEQNRADEMLIPFARAICVAIDRTARRIQVELPEGLKELNSR